MNLVLYTHILWDALSELHDVLLDVPICCIYFSISLTPLDLLYTLSDTFYPMNLMLCILNGTLYLPLHLIFYLMLSCINLTCIIFSSIDSFGSSICCSIRWSIWLLSTLSNALSEIQQDVKSTVSDFYLINIIYAPWDALNDLLATLCDALS